MLCVFCKIVMVIVLFFLIGKILQTTKKVLALCLNTKIKNEIQPMKKQVLTFALITGMIGSIAAGCSSSKNASSSDTTKKDSAVVKSMSTDTMKKDTSMKKDTAKKDTTHH